MVRQIKEKKVRARLKSAVSLAGTLSRIGSAASSAITDDGSSVWSAANSDLNDDTQDDGPVYSNQLHVPGM